MAQELLDAEVKTRVRAKDKKAVDRIAADRHLKASDIVREALREYIERNQGRGLRAEAA